MIALQHVPTGVLNNSIVLLNVGLHDQKPASGEKDGNCDGEGSYICVGVIAVKGGPTSYQCLRIWNGMSKAPVGVMCTVGGPIPCVYIV